MFKCYNKGNHTINIENINYSTMETNEKDTRRQEMEDKAFDAMRHEGKKAEESRRDNVPSVQKTSRLWVWLGVLVLIFILMYWLFAIGTFGDLANWFNG